MKVRLQKVISENSEYSRRKAEKLIEDKRVIVDGKVADEFGIKVDPAIAQIEIDYVPLKVNTRQTPKVIAFNKPIGVVASMKGEDSLEPFFLTQTSKFFHIGRLDKNSHGLLLLTNNGDIAQKIAHPANEVKKKYIVQIDSVLSKPQIKQLEQGFTIKDGTNDFVKFDKLQSLPSASPKKQVLKITLHSGKNRIIRRALGALGINVLDLQRVQIGKIKLEQLKPGKFRYLSDVELESGF